MLHLIHPFTVHFVIAFFLFAVTLEVIERFSDRHFPFLSLVYLISAIFALLVISSGCLASEFIFIPLEAESGLDFHETLGVLTGAFIFIFSIWRGVASEERVKQMRSFLWIAAIAGGIAVLLAGFTGGELVFKKGVGVEMKSFTPSPHPIPADTLYPKKIESFEKE
jgi:uncharacterized membrane protein